MKALLSLYAGLVILLAFFGVSRARPLTAASSARFREVVSVTAKDGAAGDTFGSAVAVEGSTALIGAAQNQSGRGAVYVFRRSGATWVQAQKLIPSSSEKVKAFGAAVALDGDTAIIGAPLTDVGDQVGQGTAYVFVRGNGKWSQQQELRAGRREAEAFGTTVVLEGDTGIVGAPLSDVQGRINQGTATVFTRSGGTWRRQQRLFAAKGTAADLFGAALALDGDTVLIGAPEQPPLANVPGKATFFTRDGTQWGEGQTVRAGDEVHNNYFGGGVALEGDTAVIGAAHTNNGNNTNQGAVYIFTRDGGTWGERQKLMAGDGVENDSFGRTLALQEDTLLIGAPGIAPHLGISAPGAAYVYSGGGAKWKMQQKLTAAKWDLGDYFAGSVGLYGAVALIGAPRTSVYLDRDQGRAHFFERPVTYPPRGYLPAIMR